EAFTLEDMMATLKSKEIKERAKAKGDDGEGLYVRGRTDLVGDSSQFQEVKSRSKVSRYIHELKRNLISLGTLEKEGYTVKMQSGKVKSCTGLAQKTRIYQRGGTTGAGKAGAVWQEKSRHTTQGVIDCVHSDLWDPSQVESLGGKRYFLSIVNDYSRRTGRTFKKLRTDNGLEFCNREFEQLCIESGITRHLIVVGTPQQNGVAERMNRTLMEKVRCLLIQSGLPKTFWAKATCTTAYLINRLDNESPKIVTSRNVVFNESVMYKDTLKDSGTGTDKSVKELQVEVELQGLSNRMHEEDHTDQEDGNDENAGDQETDQTPDLTNYQLVRDREPMTRTIPLRFQDESNMAAYAFAAAEEEDTHKPLTYQEAVACEDSSK
ncbi:retrovirus-related pol polyprotein from transposon TNT 1-94, partial [Tanacetum coccineum]